MFEKMEWKYCHRMTAKVWSFAGGKGILQESNSVNGPWETLLGRGLSGGKRESGHKAIWRNYSGMLYL